MECSGVVFLGKSEITYFCTVQKENEKMVFSLEICDFTSCSFYHHQKSMMPVVIERNVWYPFMDESISNADSALTC